MSYFKVRSKADRKPETTSRVAKKGKKETKARNLLNRRNLEDTRSLRWKGFAEKIGFKPGAKE